QSKDQPTGHNNGSNSKYKSSGKSRQSKPQAKGVKMSAPPKDDDEQDATCGAYADNYGTNEFWICCDMCEKWFH
ncbi:PHD finger protein alfin1-like, partial [Trifolium pratense]